MYHDLLIRYACKMVSIGMQLGSCIRVACCQQLKVTKRKFLVNLKILRLFEAGVRSGDTLCVLNPTRTQDNLIGSKLGALRALNAKGISVVDMSGISKDRKDSDQFEDLSKHISP